MFRYLQMPVFHLCQSVFEWIYPAKQDKQHLSVCVGWSDQSDSLRLTHKARGVVVPHSLGVPESFQQRVGLDDLILQSPLSTRKQVYLTLNWWYPTPPVKSRHKLTFILVLASFFLSGETAIVAKYWMTRLVLTVFPAPDSPLNKNKSMFLSFNHFMILWFDSWLIYKICLTYVIRIDWFSRSEDVKEDEQWERNQITLVSIDF